MSLNFWSSELSPISRAIDAGQAPVLITGIGPSARAHVAASIFKAQNRPLIVVCPDDSSADVMRANLLSLLGMQPLLLQSREFSFYNADSSSKTSEQKRLVVLDSLARSESSLIVCSYSSLLQRSIPKETLLNRSFDLALGQSISIEDVEASLSLIGYVHRTQVDAPGQYARRGGILDFFSPSMEYPVRMEFWGDDIDSMGSFDISSQRRIENISTCHIIPASESLPQLYPGGASALADFLSLESVKLSKSRNHEKVTLSKALLSDAEKLRESISLPSSDKYLPLLFPKFSCPLDYLASDSIVFLDQPVKIGKLAEDQEKLYNEDIKNLLQNGRILGAYSQFQLTWSDCISHLNAFPIVMAESFAQNRCLPEPQSIVSILSKQLPSYGGAFEAVCEDVSHYLSIGFSVVVLTGDSHRQEALYSMFSERNIKSLVKADLSEDLEPGFCIISTGALSGGFEYTNSKLVVLSDTQLIKPGIRKTRKPKKMPSNRMKLESYSDLSVGDLVVHEYHGIGRFAGVVKMKVDGVEKDYIKICYAGSDCLYVPAMQLDLVSKYIGAGEDKPIKLSKMGGTDWSRAKTRAKAAAKQMASELITLYAERQRLPGHAFAPDSPWQTEFEESFGYEETEDQLRCISQIKKDMESTAPMDRLLCGDVGYGKTEVALRAVMKCVLDGKQAAILVPTTVLAQQHYQTTMQRFFGYPIKIEMLSRFRSPSQIKAAKKGLFDGSVDIVIGTHALLQKDVLFKDLGLLVVDEEQRFGVSHKERLKEISRGVDVLTLSATPIPRTLNMAMSGLRDMSTLEEPPQDRVPVQTFVMEHDWGVIADAIRREIQRGGQVYYLHNMIESIDRTAARISKLLPDISVAVAHGKMSEESISSVMESMVNGETQVLVCTTIIETGIDIPNVNTLIIENADRLGLAQLHQIRGRVGRSNRRASAYLTYRKDKVLSEIAEKRLSTIREFAEFNAGFRIAMRDLEIRGAGNLLGAEQSGHLIDVGYDMYLRLLEEAVLEERGEKPEVHTDCSADLAISANIPERYVSSPETRMDLYRRIALIRSEEDADDITDELIDRFGDPPASVNTLIQVAILRGEASNAGITEISQKSGFLRFTLSDFDMAHISYICSLPEYKSRVKVEAGSIPKLSLKLQSNRHIIDTARKFIKDYSSSTNPTD